MRIYSGLKVGIYSERNGFVGNSVVRKLKRTSSEFGFSVVLAVNPPMKGGHTHNHKKNVELKSKEHNKAARQTARLVWLWRNNNRDVKFRFKTIKKWKHVK